MKLAALFSGGKDSTFAVFDSIKKGQKIKYLVTMIPKNPESYMFHYPNIEFTKYQSEAMGVQAITKNTNGEKEKELLDLKKVLEKIKNNIDGILAGGLASKYQCNRIKNIGNSLNLKIIIPLWKINPEQYWELLLKNNFKIMIIGVSCEGLGKSWLGRVIDNKNLLKLKKLSVKHRFHLAGEGGEFETFVLDCPLFKKKLEIINAERVWDRDSGFYLFKKVRLARK